MQRLTWGAGKLACALTMLVGATGCAATHHNPLPTAEGAPRY